MVYGRKYIKLGERPGGVWFGEDQGRGLCWGEQVFFRGRLFFYLGEEQQGCLKVKVMIVQGRLAYLIPKILIRKESK